LEARYANTKAVADKVDALANKVDALEKFGFTSSSAVTKQLETAVAGFQQYLKRLGYQKTVDTINVDITDKISGLVAYYEPDHRRIVIESKYAANPTILFHEYMRHVLNPVLNPRDLPFEQLWAYFAIDSGLAWYFPCSFVNNPNPAPEASTWDLTSKRKFAELRETLGDATAKGTEIWGGAFWELRRTLGQDLACIMQGEEADAA
jgi:hypothetical protein